MLTNVMESINMNLIYLIRDSAHLFVPLVHQTVLSVKQDHMDQPV